MSKDQKEATNNPKINFICTGCGACCRRVHLAAEGFPKEWIKEDNSCIKLTEDGKCSIYKDRPQVCRVNLMYKVQTRRKRQPNGEPNPLHKISRGKYYFTNNVMCNKWMDQDGLPEDLRIDLEKANEYYGAYPGQKPNLKLP